MSHSPHFAKNVFFGCIDDRLVESHMKFIIKLGGAFYPAVAGGGLAFVSESDADTALKQVVAAYAINHIDNVYLESHTECGAYALSGAVFMSPEDELNTLYDDLDKASDVIRAALAEADPKTKDEVTIHVNVVNPDGVTQPRPQHAPASA